MFISLRQKQEEENKKQDEKFLNCAKETNNSLILRKSMYKI